MAEGPYEYRTRDPVKDRDNKSAYVHLDSKYGVLSLLFNDAHNCYVHTALVTEECGGMILTGKNRSAGRTSTATLSTTNPIQPGIGPGPSW